MMWIITDKGFISAVAYNTKKDVQTGTKLSRRQLRRLGKDPILARARVKEDLEQLRPYFAALKIFEMKSSDYQYRAYLPRKAWGDFLLHKGMEIDYDSHFKEVVNKRAPEASGRYPAMMAVWTAMEKLQPRPAFGGWSAGGNLCDYRVVAERKENGDKIWGAWCGHTKGHKGKHSFEDGCQHKAHVFRDGKWYGIYRSNGGKDTESQFECAKYGGQAKVPEFEKYEYGTGYGFGYSGTTMGPRCPSKHASLGQCKLSKDHQGAHSWTYARQSCTHVSHKKEGDKWVGTYTGVSGCGWYPCLTFSPDEEDEARDVGVQDNDTVLGLMYGLAEKPIAEVRIDRATPDECWEVWAYAESLHGDQAQLTEAEVAQVVVDCIEDEQLVQYRDVYLEALSEFGYEMVDPGPAQAAEAVPSDQDSEDGVQSVQSFAGEDSLGSGAANAVDFEGVEAALREGSQR